MVLLEVSVDRPESVDLASADRKNNRAFVRSRIPIFRTPKKIKRQDNLQTNSLEVAFLSRRRDTSNNNEKHPNKGGNRRFFEAEKHQEVKLPVLKLEKKKRALESAPNLTKMAQKNPKGISNIWSQKLELLEEDSTRTPKFNHSGLKPRSDNQERKNVLHIENPGFLDAEETIESTSQESSNQLEDPTLSLECSESANSSYDSPRIGGFRSLLGLIKQRTAPVSLLSLILFGKTRNVNVRYNTLDNTCKIVEEGPAEIKWMQMNSKDPSSSPPHERKDSGSKISANQQSYKAENKDVIHFRNVLSEAKTDLAGKCSGWDVLLHNSAANLDENITGEIRTVMGQAQLLMAERFIQFDSLVDRFENPNREDKIIVKDDLEGFWEMVSFQIQDVCRKFEELQTLKQNNWEKIGCKSGLKNLKKPRARTIKLPSPSKLSKQHKEESRKRLQDAKKAMKERIKKHDCLHDDLNQKLIIK